MQFFRVAAPAGSAAFNIHFRASTTHLLKHWTMPPHFERFKARSKALHRLQTALQDTQFFFFDEISMVGRQMMGRIDSRLQQAAAGRNPARETLGGISCVCAGDPAQCETIQDQQFYDVTPHKETGDAPDSKKVQLSNQGLAIYSEFDKVVLLTTCHRLKNITKPKSAAEK